MTRYQVLARRAARRPILPETLALCALCFVDMSHTVYVVSSGLAVEGNPLLAPVIKQSWVLFAWVKALSFLIPLGAVEALRPLNPEFVKRAMRYGSIGYIAFYVIGSLQINHVFGR